MAVRIGVIGVGYLGQHHARIFSGLHNAKLVAVADTDEARCRKVAKTCGCRFTTEYKDILRECDVLSIATPTTTHYEIAMDCIAAGKHVFIEKPITDKVMSAREIVEKASLSNLIVQVGHLERYNPGIRTAAAMIKDPVFIEAERLSPFLGRATDVDVTVDLMIHDVDIVMSIVRSGIAGIRAAGESIITDKIDIATAWVEFKNGCKAIFSANRVSPDRSRKMQVFQAGSFISVDYQTQEVRRYYKGAEGVSCEVVKSETREPLKEELEDFVRCINEKRKPIVSGFEAIEALEVVLKISDLARQMQRI